MRETICCVSGMTVQSTPRSLAASCSTLIDISKNIDTPVPDRKSRDPDRACELSRRASRLALTATYHTINYHHVDELNPLWRPSLPITFCLVGCSRLFCV